MDIPLVNQTVEMMNPVVQQEQVQQNPIIELAGKKAIQAVEKTEGKLNDVQKYIVEHEGFVSGEYLDTKGVKTSGVGQTGEFQDMSFKETFDTLEKEAKRLIPKYDKLSTKKKKAIMSLMYRGDLQQSPNTRDLINKGKFKEASIELLDHEEYRGLKQIESETGQRSGIAKRLEEMPLNFLK